MPGLSIRPFPVRELPDELKVAWSDLQLRLVPEDSPFLAPGFAAAAAAVRDGVEVAVFSRGGEPAGFLPYQRHARAVAGPVAGKISGLQGLVAHGDLAWDGAALLRACGLRAFRFAHVPASERGFPPFRWGHGEIPSVDLSRGFDDWLANQKRGGSSTVRHALRKARKAGRELGPLRFALHTDEASIFDAVLAWKRRQYRETGVLDIFRYPWVVALLDRLRAVQTDRFAGCLSALWAGERLLAAHLGMRTGTAMCLWFPAYDPGYGSYSPGSILLLELIRAAAGAGVLRLDLGRGPERYKQSFMSHAVPVLEGAVDRRPLTSRLARGWHLTKAWARTSPAGLPLDVPLAWSRRLRQWLTFR